MLVQIGSHTWRVLEQDDVKVTAEHVPTECCGKLANIVTFDRSFFDQIKQEIDMEDALSAGHDGEWW